MCLDFDWVKIQELVLVFEILKLAAKLIPLLSDLVLSFLRLSNVLLIELLCLLHLLVALANHLLVRIKNFLGSLLLLDDLSLDSVFLLLFFFNLYDGQTQFMRTIPKLKFWGNRGTLTFSSSESS